MWREVPCILHMNTARVNRSSPTSMKGLMVNNPIICIHSFEFRECREFYYSRRRRSSGKDPDNCIIEESSDHFSDDEKDDIILARDKRHHRMSSVSDTFRFDQEKLLF